MDVNEVVTENNVYFYAHKSMSTKRHVESFHWWKTLTTLLTHKLIPAHLHALGGGARQKLEYCVK